MSDNANMLSRSEKILLFLFDFGEGGKKKVRYEDIVVGLFRKYPHDFHLKGYPEYPDSGDLIHKPLYDFKKKGYVNAANKVFSLTERGTELARQLKQGDHKDSATPSDRLSRSTETEASRVKSLEGFQLFAAGQKDKLSENDLYDYLGVTVRTQKNAFIGRLETMNAAVKELRERGGKDLDSTIAEYHDFLLSKYDSSISFFTRDK